jgi:hypothetical protein
MHMNVYLDAFKTSGLKTLKAGRALLARCLPAELPMRWMARQVAAVGSDRVQGALLLPLSNEGS